MSVRIQSDDDVIMEGDLESPTLDEYIKREKLREWEAPIEDTVGYVRAMMLLAPFPIAKPCVIKVRVSTPAGEVKCGTLQIVEGEPEIAPKVKSSQMRIPNKPSRNQSTRKKARKKKR